VLVGAPGGGPDAATAADACLAEALRLDPGLATDPARLRRALADLAPFDDRGGWLLSLGAAMGAPDLIARGEAAEVRSRLADVCGCRADAAGWVVATWERALRRTTAADPADALFLGEESLDEADEEGLDATVPGSSGLADAVDEHLVEQPGAPTALRLAVWPDGAPALSAITLGGAFVLTDVRQPAQGRWRRVATVRAPLSRDIALAIAGSPGWVAWSDHDGVRTRAFHRAGAAGVASLGGPRVLALAPSGEQARYPLAALAHGGSLSVLWTANRRDVIVAEVQAWSSQPVCAPVQVACPEGERLASLDTCLETERTAWLLSCTDRGTVAVARWELTFGDIGDWRQLAPPVMPASGVLADIGNAPFGIVVTGDGRLLSVDVRAAANGAQAWHSIDRPAEIQAAAPATVLAVAGPGPRAARGAPAWLALAGVGGVWVMPLAREGAIVKCGTPIRVWTGDVVAR
jgi:hypothetical protein